MDGGLFVVTVLASPFCEVSVPSVVVVVIVLLVSSVVIVELSLFSAVVVFVALLASTVVAVVVEFSGSSVVVVAFSVLFSDRLTLWRAFALASLATRASVDHFW